MHSYVDEKRTVFNMVCFSGEDIKLFPSDLCDQIEQFVTRQGAGTYSMMCVAK